MSELSTIDLEWSPDMGGKEGLSALGYERVEQLTGVPEKWVPTKNPEKWVREEFGTYMSTYIHLFEDSAVKLRYDFMDKWRGTEYEYMTVQEMTSCIKRCQELAKEDGRG